MTLATRTPGRLQTKNRKAIESPDQPASEGPSASAKKPGLDEAKILFQKFFKSIGPRTYAAQVKELANGNHLLILTEGKRDRDGTGVRKTRLFLYGEDFTAFFRLMSETAAFLRANPLPEEVRRRRDKFWAKQQREQTNQQ